MTSWIFLTPNTSVRSRCWARTLSLDVDRREAAAVVTAPACSTATRSGRCRTCAATTTKYFVVSSGLPSPMNHSTSRWLPTNQVGKTMTLSPARVERAVGGVGDLRLGQRRAAVEREIAEFEMLDLGGFAHSADMPPSFMKLAAATKLEFVGGEEDEHRRHLLRLGAAAERGELHQHLARPPRSPSATSACRHSRAARS